MTSLLLGLALLLGAPALGLEIDHNTNIASVPREACKEPFEAVGSACIYIDKYTVNNWYDARAACQAVGGDLVSITDADLMYDLATYIFDNYGRYDYWVGATDEGHEGEWLWVDGTPVDMGSPFWGYYTGADEQRPQPNLNWNCAEMARSFFLYLSDANCQVTESRGVCQML